jgi:hypothetical protein
MGLFSSGGGQAAGAEKKLDESKKYALDWAAKLGGAGGAGTVLDYGNKNFGGTMDKAQGSAGQVGNYAEQVGSQRLERANPALQGAYAAQSKVAGFDPNNPYMQGYEKAVQGVGQVGPMRGAYELAKQDAAASMAREGMAGSGQEQAVMRGLAGDYENNAAKAAIDAASAKANAYQGLTGAQNALEGLGLGAAEAGASSAQGLAGLEDTWKRAEADTAIKALSTAMGGKASEAGLEGTLGSQMAQQVMAALGLNQDALAAIQNPLAQNAQQKQQQSMQQQQSADAQMKALTDLAGSAMKMA